jgi:hypothetical protein
MRAIPSEPTLIAKADIAVTAAPSAPSTGIWSAWSPKDQARAAAPTKGVAAANHLSNRRRWFSGPAEQDLRRGRGPSVLPVAGLGGWLSGARSLARDKARLSRSATFAPSGAEAMIFLIASLTSAMSPASTASSSSARRSCSSNDTSAPATRSPVVRSSTSSGQVMVIASPSHVGWVARSVDEPSQPDGAGCRVDLGPITLPRPAEQPRDRLFCCCGSPRPDRVGTMTANTTNQHPGHRGRPGAQRGARSTAGP